MPKKKPTDLVIRAMLGERDPDRFEALVTLVSKRVIDANPDECEPFEILASCGHAHRSDSQALQRCMRRLERQALRGELD